MDVLEVLEQRGFIKQSTDREALAAALSEGLTCYVGFDPTGDSLHVGSLVPIMAASWLQRAGHKVILIVGGGTAMIGDPSGKTEARQMLSLETIAHNSARFRDQLSRFLVIDDEQGRMVDNADWLLDLRYIDFLRDIGRLFSVNRMLSAEAYKQRLEKGLSFIEFNYQILQAYDFLELYRRHGCTLQIGGDDQWGNIVAGVDLIRRLEGVGTHALTFPLITTASGAKMGKTAQGAVWLDADKLSPFDFFQYWVNVDDRDVGRFLRLYTRLDLAEIARLEALEGADIREAKRVLALEVTTLVHGAEAAAEAEAGARAMVAGAAAESLPTHAVSAEALAEGVRIIALLHEAGLTKSLGEGRRLIANGGVKLDNEKVTDVEATLSSLPDDGVVLRVGKKHAVRIVAA